MRITTERLALEPISLDYLESTYAYASDLETTRFMCFYPHDSIEETRAFIESAVEEWGKARPGRCEFVVLAEGRHIGGITLDRLEDGSVDLAWIMNKQYWGRGYATEAAKAAMAWGRDNVGMHRFVAMCDSENERSWRLMERLGMRRLPGVGKRKNRSSDEERLELTYELVM